MKSLLICLVLVLSGCSLAPDYLRPEIPTPAWRGSESTQALPNKEWWNQFGNDELNTLIQQSLTANNDMRAALQRIEEARSQAAVTQSSLFPTMNASASANRNYNDIVHGDYSKNSSYRGGLDASYTLDLFGRNRSNTESAFLTAEASVYDRDTLALVVQSDTAQAYLGLLTLNDRIDVATNNLKITGDVLRITEDRYKVGTLSALELAQEKTAYANDKSALASLIQQREIQRNQLAVLLGKPPQDFNIESSSLKQIQLPSISPIQPAMLIIRRPDIQSAEAQLKAANYDIGAARAAFFPNLSLSASSVFAASPSGTPTALTAALIQPLFSGGALQGELNFSKARKAELEENYIKTVLVAFQDVQNALAAQTAAAERVAEYTQAAEQATKAYSLARQRFDVGTIDFLTMLDTQRSQLSSQDVLITARLDQLTASISLFTAIGGGADTQATP